MRRLPVAFITVGILLTLQAFPVFSAEITILGNDYKPPKYYLEYGKPKGILIDILRSIDQETEHSFAIRLYPWKRAYLMAADGKGGIVGLSKTTERLKIFDYSDVIYYDELLLVVLKGHEFPYEKIEDLAGKRVGVRRGSSYGDAYERGKQEIFTIDEDTTSVGRLYKLLAQRIDVAIIGPGKAGFNNVLRNNPALMQHKDAFVVLKKPFMVDPNYLGFAKTMHMQDFLQEFNRILHKKYKDGTVQRVIDTYMKQAGTD